MYMHSYLITVNIGFDVRYFTDVYKCLYADLKDSCNATASAVYTDYHVRQTNRWIATMNCSDISELFSMLSPTDMLHQSLYFMISASVFIRFFVCLSVCSTLGNFLCKFADDTYFIVPASTKAFRLT